MDKKNEVPYVSQYRDVQNPDSRLHSCGMTCAYMVLSYFNTQTPTLDDLIDAGISNGGYGKSGWKHDYLVNLFQEMGYVCERKEGMRDTDTELLHQALLKGCPVIVSAERRMFDRRTFHMILLTGVREKSDGTLEGFFYHDPASRDTEGGEHLYVPLASFFLSWRRMAIFPTQKGG